MSNLAIEWAREHCGMYSTCGDVITVGQLALMALVGNAKSLASENTALRREVNALRAILGWGREYVEYDEDKPTGGCPVSGG